MTTALWKLNKICEKHNITIAQLSTIFRGIDSGAFDSEVLEQYDIEITPKLQGILDDLIKIAYVEKIEKNS